MRNSENAPDLVTLLEEGSRSRKMDERRDDSEALDKGRLQFLVAATGECDQEVLKILRMVDKVRDGGILAKANDGNNDEAEDE